MITHKNTHLFDSATDELEFWNNVYAEWNRKYAGRSESDDYVTLSDHFAATQRYIDYYRDFKDNGNDWS